MAIVYPDIEKLLVSYLTNALDSLGSDISSDVRVATRKAPPGEPVSKEVVIIGGYTNNLDVVRQEASAVIDIYASDYETASSLGLLVAALIVEIPGDAIKKAAISLGPVRLMDESPLEKRSLTLDLIVKGYDL